ncbi:2-methylcitrate dehydratase PrpD [Methanobrevibacter ruminantium M1]|uniref:2-methylcitrate dehydratase PrpD n=1 Tax=Methanobrevibacter ruminantium (strain ATCC 35063 / DSM 1093 / JCM 13430 / OCM 146 / M1) TaxID=634498 RepID=D3E1X8_METRM|nr:MmgE/PrpD family protein [Methanobrevibacter ruminantium]ADC46539.1 2-methylcitrate dehydratase PrpD [Methanobrevibacter ruminantium M1]
MIIHELSRFLIDLKYDDIPKESIEKAKLCFLDYLSVYFRGLESENSKIAIKTIYKLFGDNFNSLNKAFINGIASHSLDLDDGHRLAQLHPGSIVFSSLLALISDKSLDLDISTEKFIESIVAGYEVAIALGILVNPNHRNQGFHSTGTIGTIAAGAVASKILNLNLEQTEHCLGLCTTQSAGLLEADHAGTMGKSFHVGNACYGGIISAFLAKNGFTGGESIIDGKEGFLKAMSLKTYEDYLDADNNDLDYLRISKFLEDNLGKFHINEVYLKKFPFCRHIHSSIDSTLYLKESIVNSDDFDSLDSIGLDSIDSIEVKTYKIASEHDNFNPKNPQDLKQSLPYAVAISLVLNDLSLDSIDELKDDGLFDEKSNKEYVLKIKEIISKINIIYDKDLDDLAPQMRPSQVTIKFKDNSRDSIKHTVYYPLGEVENPLSEEDILEKFKLLNPKFNIDKLQIIKHMEEYSIDELFRELDLID